MLLTFFNLKSFVIMLIVCIFASTFKTMLIMFEYSLINDFDKFRKWFNRHFSLSLNGKFVGIGRLKDWQRFAYRLYKELHGYFRRPSSDIICMRVSGQTVKLYNR